MLNGNRGSSGARTRGFRRISTVWRGRRGKRMLAVTLEVEVEWYGEAFGRL